MKSVISILICLLVSVQIFAQNHQKIDDAVFTKAVFVEPNPPKPVKGWQLVENWNPADGKETNENFVNVPVLVGEYPGKIIKFQFKGNAVGVAVPAVSDAGIIEYSVDGSDWQKQDLFVPLSREKHAPLYFTLGKDLKNQKHILQIRLTGDKNSESSGNKCVIRYFYFSESN